MDFITPTISDIIMPEAPALPPAIQPFVWTAYGTLIQDYLDGRIQDVAAYYSPLAVVYAEINLERDKIFRKYHSSRKEMLAVEGRKNLTLMPGYLQRKLMDLALDEKRETSEAAAKIAARHAETSLDNVYAGADAALTSDGLRSEMHYRVQQASFEVAKAALMAGYEQAKLRVMQYESSLKAIETNFDLIKIEYKALADAMEQEIAVFRIAILEAENIGNAEELQRLAAELESAQKSIEVALSRIPVAEAELQKLYADMGVLRAEQALYAFKALTAQASMEKSQARSQDASRVAAKIDVELQRVALQRIKDSAETDSELSVIDARKAEEELDNVKAMMQVANIQLDAVLADARSQMALDDASSRIGMATQTSANAAARVGSFAARIAQAANNYSALSSKMTSLISYIQSSYTSWTAQTSKASIDEQAAIIEAATNAANADVSSTFVYKKGTGAPP